MKLNKRWLVPLTASFLLVSTYQNCSKVQVSSSPALKTSDNPDDPQTPTGDPIDPGNPAGNYTATFKFKPSAKMADIILVVDNSRSMQADSAQLASRLNGFVSYLKNDLHIDWQMCLTTTDLNKSSDRAIKWSGTNSYVVNSSTANLDSVFANSVNERFPVVNGQVVYGSGTERGVASLNKHIDYQSTHHCYRAGAVTSTIVISDENESSSGANLQSIDYPSVYLSKIGDLQVSLGYHANVVSNAIVIKSGDKACFDMQDASSTAYYGTVYEDLAQLTQGNVGSICASDYTDNLNDISARIDNASLSLLLKCVPISGSVQLVSSTPGALFTWDVRDNRIFVTSGSSSEFDLNFKYACK